jgi:hypothetical protein
VLHRAGIHIPEEYHVDIQDMFRIKDDNNRVGMADLAKAFIDESYKDMKKKFPEYMHNFWDWKPLAKDNLHYAAIDGYVSYELYRRINAMNDGQHHLQASPLQMVYPRCIIDAEPSTHKKRP